MPKYDRLFVRLGRGIAGLIRTIADTHAIFRRKSGNNDTDFTPALRPSMKGHPNSSCKNYHEKTDGYFSYASARRFEVRYELVFYGQGNHTYYGLGAHVRELTRLVVATTPNHARDSIELVLTNSNTTYYLRACTINNLWYARGLLNGTIE